MKKKITIGITDCSKYANYEKWILAEPDVEVVKLGYGLNNAKDAERCDGVILSGGEDVHPRYYKKPEYESYCSEIDEKRDAFEFSVLDQVEKHQLPLLGICRGLQVANVYYGGTLVPDIPSFGKFNHSRYPDRDRYHQIDVDTTSELFKITGIAKGEINSAHHQSAELIAKGLVTNSLSADGIVEGIERQKNEGKPFFQLVQWHPERMINLDNPFSKKIKEAFINAMRNS
jgi:putative glutamine amidotransferase